MADGGGPITADSGTLERGFSDLGKSLAALVSALRELDGQLETSLAEWSGSARETYDAAHAQWWRAAANLTGTLTWLRGVISTAHANYGNAEDSVLRAFTPGDE